MKELLLGILDFRVRFRQKFLPIFKKLATHQKPNSLFLGCSDSRVVPNLFASTNPGDVFMVRNVGNLIPPTNESGKTSSDESEIAAVEFSLDVLNVDNVIVCGHSECGAMKRMISQLSPDYKPTPTQPHLESWLRHARPALDKYKMATTGSGMASSALTFSNGKTSVAAHISPTLPPHDQLSQVNVLQQVDNLSKYSIVRDRVLKGNLLIHAWWFDIPNADVYSFSDKTGKFVLIDEEKVEILLNRLGNTIPVQELLTTLRKDDASSLGPLWQQHYISKEEPDGKSNKS